MDTVNFYHSYQELANAGLEPFLDHVLAYLTGRERFAPQAVTNAVQGNPEILLAFSDQVLKRLSERENAILKDYDTAVRFGFRGYSRGERNRIFLQLSSKEKIKRDTERSLKKNLDFLMEEFDTTAHQLDSFEKIKVVHHQPHGRRLVGIYNKIERKAALLGDAHY